MKNALTQEQQNRFASINHRLGLTGDAHLKQDAVIKEVQAKKQNLVFSSDPLESDVPPIHVSVGSVAEFKSMVGVPNEEDDSHIDYPAPMEEHHARLLASATSKADLLTKMDESFAFNMRKAANAYIMGDARKVMEYEDLINAVMFPGRIAVFTGNDLDIPAGETYVIQGTDPVVWNFECIEEGAGSEILITTMAKINTQYFTQK